MSDKPQYKSPTGAVRAAAHSEQVRYDLLLSNDVAMRRLAETFAEGFKKYGPDNWKRGFPVSELWAHAFIHLIKWIAGDKSEDHLAHACWNFMAIMWQEENKPELQDFPPIRVTIETTPDAPGKQAAIATLQKDGPRGKVHNYLACPLFEGTVREGTDFHDQYVYTPAIPGGLGRCVHCSARRGRHAGAVDDGN